ncbi:MAG: methionine--tRNA ligase [Candidatus Moranbacteria bacterium]|nr:methionine--tRNA ligase [Candidatus Moranbacteria bacterium]
MENRKETFYITTTLPYVNAEPHIGFASEIVIADARARFEREQGKKVIFNTGTDEHGVKIWQKAQEENKDVQEYVDEYAAKFDDLKKMLNLSYTNFIRTTDENHVKAAQEFWKIVDENGFIYKKQYKVKYCVGCELNKTDSELDHEKCPLHPNKELEFIDEENYFFKFSEFQERLLKLYEENPEFVKPKKRLNEIRAFVERGLEDFSISRVKEKMPWGVPVPGDEDQVMYVWFDALVNYISTLGWSDDQENFEKFWGTSENSQAIQIAGKDNLRQQSAMWQAMLMAAILPVSQQVFINGFIGVDGQKMSKSIGNVISPKEMVEKFGVDGTRYLLLTKGSFGEDNDISWDQMTAKYNADLANGLGNLVSRVIKLGENVEYEKVDKNIIEKKKADLKKFVSEMEFEKYLSYVWEIVRASNKLIEETKPWELAKNDEIEFEKVMKKLIQNLQIVSQLLIPVLPETAEKIENALETKERIILFKRLK